MTEFWNKLSPRERRLALATAGVILACLAFFLVSRARNRVRDLDVEIDRLEQTLVNYKEQAARSVSVDTAFAEVAAQHSSEWNEAEIHNRLRQEIYRLAMEDPGAAPGASQPLVAIPSLREGALREGGEGYREYQLTIKIPSADVYSIVIFLMRLLASPQSLRIDGLDLARHPQSQLMSATVNVTRTVVDGVQGAETAPETPTEEGAVAEAPDTNVQTWDGLDIEGWTAQDATLSLVSEASTFYAGGGKCLGIAALQAGASVYLTLSLDQGARYQLTLDSVAKCQTEIRVVSAVENQPIEGEKPLMQPDGKPYRYRLKFDTPPGDGTIPMLAPYVVLPTPGCEVFIDNVRLVKIAE